VSLRTPLCELFGIELPIVQAPVSYAPALVAAVSNAGGLGMIQLSWLDSDGAREVIRETRRLTDRPFGVNLVLEWPQDERLELSLEEGVRIVSLFWGDPSPYIARAHEAGGTALCTVGSAAEAREVVAAGADAVVAQGWEAGGHVRGEVATLPLVPTVVDAVAPVPVVAAGGIADGRGLAAALALGAAGAWVGTRFVASHESLAHDIYKQRLVAAGTDDTYHGHFYSYGWKLGTPYRVIRSKEAWNPLHLIAGGARKGDEEKYARGFSVYGGQGVDKIKEILGAGQIVQRLMRFDHLR